MFHVGSDVLPQGNAVSKDTSRGNADSKDTSRQGNADSKEVSRSTFSAVFSKPKVWSIFFFFCSTYGASIFCNFKTVLDGYFFMIRFCNLCSTDGFSVKESLW